MNDIDLPPRRLVFSDVAPGRSMHAALIDPAALRGPGELHTHADFREMFLVLGGRGWHVSNGRKELLKAGHLALIRPWDVHGYRLTPGQELSFLNVAFPEARWAEFLRLAELKSQEWDEAAFPPSWSLEPVAHARAEGVFRQALTDFRLGGRAIHLTRFLGALLPVLVEDRPVEPRADLPAWLGSAMAAMERPENLALGLPRFVELAGVSLPHLCRTMRARTGRTPTEFVNDLRVQNAAALLATTRLEIAEITERCGFESLSYFHRQFRRRFGTTPMAYRRAEWRIVAG